MQTIKPLALSIALVNASFIAPALAQESAPAEGKGWALEEIVVTATKRETNLMETPVAVTALSADAMARQGVKNLKDIGDLVPSLSITMDNGQSTPIIAMRGVRSTNTTELGDPAVGLHIDGVYSPRMQGMNAMMLDVERVEVLRGPQGTLFGRNSTVGSINILTVKPDMDDLSGSLTGEVGRFDNREFGATVNVPVSDTFALRFAAKAQKRDSYITGYYDPNQYDQRYLPDGVADAPVAQADELYTPSQNANWWLGQGWAGSDGDVVRELTKADPSDFYGNVNEYSFRLAARWQPSDDLTADVSYQKFGNDSAGGINLPNCEKLRGRTNGDGDLNDCGNGLLPEDDNYQAVVNIPGMLKLDIDYVRATVDYAINDNIDLVWIGGYEHQNRQSAIDNEAGLQAYDGSMFFHKGTGAESYSNEIQLKSTNAENYTWILGVNQFHEKTTTKGHYNNSMDGKTFWDQPNRSTDAWSAFTQATYDVTNKLHLVAGLRYSSEEKQDKGGRNLDCIGDCAHPDLSAANKRTDYNALPADYFSDPALYDQANASSNENQGEWDNWDYRVGLDYDVSDDTMLYVSYATGFKSGGIGDVVTRTDPKTDEEIYHRTSFEPEHVGTFEIGAKSQLLDDTLNVAATYFYSDYQDMQYASVGSLGSINQMGFLKDENGDPILDDNGQTQPAWEVVPLVAFYTRNVPDSVIQGLELEFDWAPYPNGRISGFTTITSAKVVEDWNTKWDYNAEAYFGLNYADSIDPENEVLNANLKDNDLAVTPKYDLNINYEHTFNFSNGATLKPWVNVHWQSESYLTVWNVDKHTDDMDFVQSDEELKHTDDKQEAYYMVNASLKYAAADNQWYAEAFVNNATDKVVQYWGGTEGGVARGSMSMPRYYGMRMGYNF